MARIYSNENFPLPVVEELRRLGHDVLTTQDAGRANQGIPDEAVFEFAIQERRAVLTHNRRHFFRIARNRPSHFGVIAAAADPDFPGFARRIHEQIIAVPSLDGIILRIHRPS